MFFIKCNCGKAGVKVWEVFKFMWEQDIVKFKCPICKKWIMHNDGKWKERKRKKNANAI